jgi:hypothetical protein
MKNMELKKMDMEKKMELKEMKMEMEKFGSLEGAIAVYVLHIPPTSMCYTGL